MRADGRIEGENDPDRSAGPRFWLGGSVGGNVWGIRADVADETGAELTRLAASEPPFLYPSEPVHLRQYLSLLGDSEGHNFGLIYELPHGLFFPSEARLIRSGTAEGGALLQLLADQGIPSALVEIGFVGLEDFWQPWCALLMGNEIASIAFAARLSEVGAELGLVTAKPFRGMGLGAAAAAGWSQLPPLQARTLFYSADWTNISSQRVAERLGLRLRGASLRIA